MRNLGVNDAAGTRYERIEVADVAAGVGSPDDIRSEGRARALRREVT